MVTYAEYIKNVKIEGYRPCIIGALVCNGFIGLSKSNKYPGFEFLQGGIEYGETPIEAIERETIEEMGYWFHKQCHFPPKRYQYLFEDRLETKVKDPVSLGNNSFKAKGKHYIIYAVEIDPINDELPKINPEDFKFEGTTVKFHELRWVKIEEALKLIKTITNPKKLEIAKKAISMLKEFNYI